MGCGASTATGRDSRVNIHKEAEGFFPPREEILKTPPETTKSPYKANTATKSSNNHSLAKPESAAGPSPVKKKKKKEAYVPPPAPLVEPPAPKLAASSASKKTPYVPPAPITVTAEEEQPPPAKTSTSASSSSPSSSAVEQGPGKLSSNDDDTDLNASERSLNASDALFHPPDEPEIIGSVADLLGNDSNIFDIIGHPEPADQQDPTETEEYDGSMSENKMFDPESIHETPQPSSESGMRFDELYRLKGVLGTGAFSTVREGYHRSNSHFSYAVKCINRKKLSEEDEAALLDEVGILKELRHVHIIRLYDFFVEPSTYYLVMERMRGGELFDRIVAKAYYNEKEARDTCKVLLEAVQYLHENHVAHRDLKPENLLLLSEEDDSAVKIADFGFAKKVYEHNCLTTQCGTPGYVAPEILEGTPYDERADMWSVGVILYILLGGYPPFIESTQRDLFRKIRKGEYEFHEEYWGTVSTEAKDLISALLTVNVNDRLTADEALENSWILGDAAKLAKRDLGLNLEKFRNFNAKRKFRAAVSTIMAINKLNSLREDLFVPVKETTVQEIVNKEISSHGTRSGVPLSPTK